MKSVRMPALLPGPKQLNLLFDAGRATGLGAGERRKVVLALAQILMQAAGLAAEEIADDER